MSDDKIICPHCERECEPTDNEDCNIEFAPFECEHCGKDFWISRSVTVSYYAWIDDDDSEAEEMDD